MEHQGQPGTTEPADDPLETGMVIGMAVGQDDGPKVAGANVEHIQVVHGGVAPQSGVVQHRLSPVSVDHRDQ
jgi:hypothetical protein